ncbi:MAG TPA: MFS transporter [Kribbellaceae bacterium]|nr:MFS transporter [Kribbellaceae bacterium]
MSATLQLTAPVTATRERLLTPQLVRVLVAVFGSCLNFYLLIAVVPLYLAQAGWGGAGAGLATGAMMLATVLTELAVPVLVARFGYRALLGAGLVLLGVPSLVLALSAALPVVLAVCLTRGAGLAIMFVADTALVAQVVPAHRRGEALGLTGVVAGVPAVIGLPLGIELTRWAGFEAVFVLAAVAALAGLAALPGLPGLPGPNRSRADRSRGTEHAERPADVVRALRTTALRRPTLVFGMVALAGGIVATFLPLAATDGNGSLVTVALLVQAAGAPLARWWAGRYGDRHGHRRLLVPSVLVTAVGAASLVWLDNPVAVVGGMVLFGVGFGAAQNVTLSVMFERVPESQYGRVSALWSIAYDAGWGVGAVAFGAVVGSTGYATAFGLTALVLFAALAPARRDARI